MIGLVSLNKDNSLLSKKDYRIKKTLLYCKPQVKRYFENLRLTNWETLLQFNICSVFLYVTMKNKN